MNLRTVGLALALALIPLATRAESAAPPKLAVPAVRALGDTADQVAGLSALIAAEAARHRLKVLAGADLVSLIGLEREKQLLGGECSDSKCLTELAGALGADLLLSSETSKVGSVWVLSVVLLDVRRNSALRRATLRASRPDELADLAAGAVHEVLQAHPFVEGAAPRSSSGRRTFGLALDAAGLLALGGGVAFGVLASNAERDATALADRARSGEPVSRAEFDARWDAAQSDALIADVLFGVGAVALGAGLYFTFTEGDSSSRLTLSPGPGGATLSFCGALP